ncbi:unnamed protein product [Calicophoron daubneyi]|uniref:NOC3-like protein n=1 Tax=Calicophoron daubneyi TaxID=300641 RepID=A0AAV2THZ6_CALDB
MTLASIPSILLASLCVVFKDILPAYKIRPLTDTEKSQPMKKETRKIRFFEENLLSYYKKYIVALQSSLTERPKSDQEVKQCPQVEQRVVLNCACQLLESHPNFNFFDELLSTVVPYLNSPNVWVQSLVLSTIRCVLKSDRDGDASLLVCRTLHSFCRKRSYKVRPPVIKALASVPITEIEHDGNPRRTQEERMKLSRKERKANKLQKKFEKAMAETDATQSHERRKKLNTLMLNEILFVFFKILKMGATSELLSAVLDGLSIYANLINVVYVDSLLSILNSLISNESTGLLDSLNCVHTALKILNNPASGSALESDPTRFYNHLYSLLGRMVGVSAPPQKTQLRASHITFLSGAYGRPITPASIAVSQCTHRAIITGQHNDAEENKQATESGSSRTNIRVNLLKTEELTDVMLSCLNLLLIHRKRDVSTNRVLGFVKRLIGAALTMSEPSCAGAVLVRLHHLFRLFPQCEVLFDSETEIGGAYKPDVDDPEICLPASSCLWELALLHRHFSPLVQNLAKAASQWGRVAVLSGSTEASLLKNHLRVGSVEMSIEQLIQLSPSECRVKLAELEQSWSTQRCVKISKKRSRRSSYCCSDWLKELLVGAGIESSGFLSEFSTKKLKLTNT